MFKEYSQYDALGLAELVIKGEISSKELLEAAIAKSNELNPTLNAIIHRFDERAFSNIKEGLPAGPFCGVPFLFKDLTAIVKGEPITMGTRGMNWVPDYNSEHVKRILKTGINPFGKTNTPEFGLIITTEPKAHGAAHNPHKQGYSTGGSSGGSACAVAAGIVPMAGAGDGGGSIRFPASWCGAFGFKPSRGLTPIGPDYGEAWEGAVIDHIISRSVRDSAAMLDHTAGYQQGGPYKVDKDPYGYLNAAIDGQSKDVKPLRIGVAKKPLIENTEIDPEVLNALDKTAKILEGLGHHIEEAEPAIDTSRFGLDFLIMVCSHTAVVESGLKKLFGKNMIKQFEPRTKNTALIGRSLRAEQLIEAMKGWHLANLAMASYFTKYDVMLCPTVPTPAVRHGVLPPSGSEEMMMNISGLFEQFGVGKIALKYGLVEKFAQRVMSKMAFTILGNTSGLPAMSVPLHMSSEGLPIGMQFYGRMGEDTTLFTLAASLERENLFSYP